MIFKNKQQTKEESSTQATNASQLTSIARTPISNNSKEPITQQTETNKTTLTEAPSSASRGRKSKASIVPANNKDYESVSNYLSDIVVEAADSDSVNSSSNSSCNNSRRGRPKKSITQAAAPVAQQTSCEKSAQRLSIPRAPESESTASSLVNSARKRSSALPSIAPLPPPAPVKTEPTFPKPSASQLPPKPSLPPLPPSQLNKKPKRPVESIYDNVSKDENSMKPPQNFSRPPVPPNVLRASNSLSSLSNSSTYSSVNDTMNSTGGYGGMCPRSPQSPNPSGLHGKKMRMSPEDECDENRRHTGIHFPTG
jgi:hypothetical protein